MLLVGFGVLVICTLSFLAYKYLRQTKEIKSTSVLNEKKQELLNSPRDVAQVSSNIPNNENSPAKNDSRSPSLTEVVPKNEKLILKEENIGDGWMFASTNPKDKSNVRAATSTESVVIGQIGPNTEILVRQSNLNEWFEVKLGEGKIGYLRKDRVLLRFTEIIASVSPPSQSGDNLYVRTKSGKEYLLYLGINISGANLLPDSAKSKSPMCLTLNPPKSDFGDIAAVTRGACR
jgi:hypothetical protein